MSSYDGNLNAWCKVATLCNVVRELAEWTVRSDNNGPACGIVDPRSDLVGYVEIGDCIYDVAHGGGCMLDGMDVFVGTVPLLGCCRKCTGWEGVCTMSVGDLAVDAVSALLLVGTSDHMPWWKHGSSCLGVSDLLLFVSSAYIAYMDGFRCLEALVASLFDVVLLVEVSDDAVPVPSLELIGHSELKLGKVCVASIAIVDDAEADAAILDGHDEDVVVESCGRTSVDRVDVTDVSCGLMYSLRNVR